MLIARKRFTQSLSGGSMQILIRQWIPCRPIHASRVGVLGSIRHEDNDARRGAEYGFSVNGDVRVDMKRVKAQGRRFRTIEQRALLVIWVHRCVVAMEAHPSHSCTTRIPTPLFGESSVATGCPSM